jgi:hypothetical protein
MYHRLPRRYPQRDFDGKTRRSFVRGHALLPFSHCIIIGGEFFECISATVNLLECMEFRYPEFVIFKLYCSIDKSNDNDT